MFLSLALFQGFRGRVRSSAFTVQVQAYVILGGRETDEMSARKCVLLGALFTADFGRGVAGTAFGRRKTSPLQNLPRL